jgi:hypothetical protein
MAEPRGKQRVGPETPVDEAEELGDADAPESPGAIPELMRRAITLGLTGFFTTEEAVRRALGDTVPKDWTDYLSESSDRTRSEFLDRLSREIAKTLKEIDLADVLRDLLQGRTLTVNAEFKLGDASEGGNKAAIRFGKQGDDADQ